jgi:hypothetical protein
MPRKLSKIESTLKAARIEEYRPFKILCFLLYADMPYITRLPGGRILFNNTKLAHYFGITSARCRTHIDTLQNTFNIITDIQAERGWIQCEIKEPNGGLWNRHD